MKRSLLKPAGVAVEALLRVLYPPCCFGCGARLPEPSVPVCGRCLRRLERPAPEHIAAELARLPEAHRALDGALALWRFDTGGTIQRMQHRLKYGNRPGLGVALGRLLGRACREALPRPTLVLAVPLYRLRRYERGYNQSAMLARGVGEALNVATAEGLLVRRRPTRTQTRLSRRRRWENVAGAFAVTQPEAIRGQAVLLIDDVFTTGATLAAAGVELREAGASSIHAATLALAR